MPTFLLPNNPMPQLGLPIGAPGANISNFANSLPNSTPKRSVNFIADAGGCGHFRMIWPSYLLNIYQKGIVTCDMAMIFDPRYYQDVRTVRVQRQATPHQVNFLKHLKEISKKNNMKLLYDVDDVIFREDIPPYNGCRHAFLGDEIRSSSVEAMLLCDKMTVCSDYMADYYRKKTGHPNIFSIPNYLPKFWFDRYYSASKIEERYNKHRKKPRVGVFASGTHVDANQQNNDIDDFTHVNDVIIKTCKDIQWVVVGSKPRKLSPYIDQGLIEFKQWVNLNDYPDFMDKMDVNLTFAPLVDNEFNRSKSDIKILEAGALGVPCICQDLVTYSKSPLKFTTGDDLLNKIVTVMKDSNSYFKYSKEYRSIAESRWLEDHLNEYVDLYELN